MDRQTTRRRNTLTDGPGPGADDAPRGDMAERTRAYRQAAREANARCQAGADAADLLRHRKNNSGQ